MNVILGGGLCGLSTSYHLGHSRCLVLEAKPYWGGHARSERWNGAWWDEGPHISFTKSEYVRDLFAASVAGEFHEFEAIVKNYDRGTWIDHPAQTNLFQLPEPERVACIKSFLEKRKRSVEPSPKNYGEWLECAFGPAFAHAFPFRYTRKYWTVEPTALTTDWIGERVYLPTVDEVIQGSLKPLPRSGHYITTARYPRVGGFQSFVKKLEAGANVQVGAEVERISLGERRLWTKDGRTVEFSRLISTIPLPVLVRAIDEAPDEVRSAAERLTCSSVVLVNLIANGELRQPAHWFYVYDEDKLSTRVTDIGRICPTYKSSYQTLLQVEVYFSRFRPQQLSLNDIQEGVAREIASLDLFSVAKGAATQRVEVSRTARHVRWANVMFTHETKPALEEILSWLSSFGLVRESGDTSPLTNWEGRARPSLGHIILGGRYGQWKYYWTDDCVLRGVEIAAGAS